MTNVYVCVLQAYTSQFVSLIMFGLMTSEDRLSLQKRRLEIMKGLRMLPGELNTHAHTITYKQYTHTCTYIQYSHIQSHAHIR